VSRKGKGRKGEGTQGKGGRDRLDLVVVKFIEDSFRFFWMRGSGGGGFEAPLDLMEAPSVFGYDVSFVKLVDMDRDGVLDLVVAMALTQVSDKLIFVAWGRGGGRFSAWESLITLAFPTNRVVCLEFADFDSDGYLDVVFATSLQTLQIAVNKRGRSQMMLSTVLQNGYIFTGCLAEDFDCKLNF